MLCFGLLSECAGWVSPCLVKDADAERTRNLCAHTNQFRYEKCWGRGSNGNVSNNPRIKGTVFTADKERGQKKLSVWKLDEPQEDRTIEIVAVTTSWAVLLPSQTMQLRPLSLASVKITYFLLDSPQAYSTTITLVLNKDTIYSY